MDAIHGEGPIWVEREQALYWVDIQAPAIWRMDDASGALRKWTPPGWICSIAPRAGGGFIAGAEHGFMAIDLDADRYDLIANPEQDLPTNRFNDGKVDRRGRFWAGTMDNGEKKVTGSLYRLDPDLSWTKIDSNYHVTNGPAFDAEGRLMYHTDSGLRTIYLFDVDGDGNVSNKRVFATFDEQQGYPDGMTVDAEGCLWVAFWDGWCVRRLSSEGRILREIKIPTQRTSSCMFGGPKLDRLYVTSCRTGLDEKTLAAQPLAGALFMIETDVCGIAERPFG